MRIKTIYIFFISVLTIYGPLLRGQEVSPAINFRVVPFDYRDVQLIGGPFKEAMDRNHTYLLSLQCDRLLHNFRINAHLPSQAFPLGGWEDLGCELRGHFTGHYLSAASIMFRATGDLLLKAKIDSLVSGLAKCQVALGDSGYLSAFPLEFIDRVEAGKNVWAPWYTLHKILAGLLDAYQLAGNNQALEVATRLGNWVFKRTGKLDHHQLQVMLKNEFGGMAEALENLYAYTGNKDFLVAAGRFEQDAFFDPLYHYQDKLKGLHANTQIPKIIGAARAYELTGEIPYANLCRFFWTQVANGRCYTTGGTSHYEYWRSEPYQLSGQLGAEDHENCCTYNMLRLTSHLFEWTADPVYADYYERALYNGIMGTQHPEKEGAFMYYVPMRSGLFRYYCDPENSYVCCSGTGMESFAKFTGTIYYHDSVNLFVNLFIPSQLTWKDKGLVMVQKTDYPAEEGTTFLLKLRKPAEFTISLRVPYWAEKECEVKINGKRLENSSSPESFINIHRVWKDGDKLRFTIPMTLHLSRMPDNPSRVAILYGPVVLAGALGQQMMSREMQYGIGDTAYRMHISGAAIEASHLVTDEQDLNRWIVPVKGEPLTFKTQGAGIPEDVTLVPFYSIYGQRYALYWDLFTQSQWKDYKTKTAVPDNVIDLWTVGDSISDDVHNFQAYWFKSGEQGRRKWVSSSSWFRFDINVLPDKQVVLRIVLDAEDSTCLYKLEIDGAPFSVPDIFHGKSGIFVSNILLPFTSTQGKSRVAISFKVPDKKEAEDDKQHSRFETPRLFEAETVLLKQ